MRFFIIVCISMLCTVGFSACNRKAATPFVECKGDCITVRGTLQQQGMTTYQYGTHTISTAEGNAFVLKSDVVDLKKFEGRKVKLTAQNLHYTVENGPELYNVVAIKEID
jgi:hypothetical protein